jgi:hypothetical protein
MNEHALPLGVPDDESRELEQALATLRPMAGAIDRDRLMFLAGRSLGEGSQLASGSMFAQWMWPSATGVSAVTAAVLGLLLAISHRPLVVREKVYVHAPAPPGSTPLVQDQPPPGQSVPHGAHPWEPPGRPDMPDTPGAAPGMMAEQSIVAVPADAPRHAIARENIALVDYRPRSTLPPSSYLHKRRVALSLGVDALGSWTGASGVAEQPLAYHTLFSGTMIPTN